MCSAFLPGDKIAVIGTKDGNLELYDLPSSSLLENINAHEGPVWSVQVSPDRKGIVTGSADKSVKFWTVDVVVEDVPGAQVYVAVCEILTLSMIYPFTPKQSISITVLGICRINYI